jgi:glutamate-5-semialdehyde dehydrogenase
MNRSKKEPENWLPSSKKLEIMQAVRQAKIASRQLLGLPHEQRTAALLSMAENISNKAQLILKANSEDIEHLASTESLALSPSDNALANDALLKRLVLSQSKLDEIVLSIKQVAAMPDPIGKTLMARELAPDLILNKISCPIGLIAVIFESRPDALPQILSLCLKSGNAAILKGGKEAERTNCEIFNCIETALNDNDINSQIFALTHSREDIEKLLTAKGLIDLIIPRGSNDLVNYIQSHTQIPVLGHAAGICHIFVDQAADLAKALRICVDAKTSYPAACNAVETVLVHERIAQKFIPQLLRAMQANSVEVRADIVAKNVAGEISADKASKELTEKLTLDASESDFGKEFSSLIIALKVVSSLDNAIEHINAFSSNHTDAIITEDDESAAKFFAQVDSAGVYQNVSTRFADGFRYGFGAEVGISNGKLHPRGPVGLDGLTTYKYRLKGNGHIVTDYSGDNADRFTHRDLNSEEGNK